MGIFRPTTLNPDDGPRVRLGRRLHWAGLMSAGAALGAFPLLAPSDLSGPPDYPTGLAISALLAAGLVVASRALRYALARE